MFSVVTQTGVVQHRRRCRSLIVVVRGRAVDQRPPAASGRPAGTARARRRPGPRGRSACRPCRTGSPSGCSAARKRGVLTGGRERLRRDLLRLQVGDDGVGVVVVGVTTALMSGGRCSCSNVVAATDGRPRAGRLTDLDVGAVVELRLEDASCSPARTAWRCCRSDRRPSRGRSGPGTFQAVDAVDHALADQSRRPPRCRS